MRIIIISYFISLITFQSLSLNLKRHSQALLHSFSQQVAEWVGGKKYNTGDQVTKDGKIYKCKVGEWCSLAVYDPTGIYGNNAWDLVGNSDQGDVQQKSEFIGNEWLKGKTYQSGNLVCLGNKVFSCKLPNWCNQEYYKPGGAAYNQAWEDQTSKYSKVTCQQNDQGKVDGDTDTTDSGGDDNFVLGPYSLKDLPGTESLPAETGPWTGHDWEDPQIGFKISNGRVIGTKASLERKFKTTARCGVPKVDLANPMNNGENVQRIMRVMPQSVWEYLMPIRDSAYTYEQFLKAAAKFPAFCGEKPADNQMSMDDLCKMELSTQFAHYAQETGAHYPSFKGIQEEWRQGLYFIREMGCENGGCSYTQCSGWAGVAYPCQQGAEYYGRGAKQLSYNYNYGPFSKVMFGDVMVLLKDPDRVAREGWLAVASAFWFYMTPQSPKPSIHDVVTRFWKPNAKDIENGIKLGFGTTINIINGGLECGHVDSKANNRINYYKEFMKYFKVAIPSDEEVSCASSQNAFPADGAGFTPSYWEQDYINANRCKPVKYQTPYSFWIMDGYKNCVKAFFG